MVPDLIKLLLELLTHSFCGLPVFPGNFESYWHFLHQGRRFGHWLGCAVIVDADVRSSPTHSLGVKPQDGLDVFPNDQGPLPVDLTMKCAQTNNTQSCSDDMKIYNIESQPENVFVKEENKEASVKNKEEDLNFDLEEFPRLESYTTVPVLPETFPDEAEVPQPNDDSSLTSLPLLTSAKYHPTTDKYEELIQKVQNISLASESADNQKTDYEYLSGSDTDNISIISGTVSVDTDTEPTDEFVIVPPAAEVADTADTTVPEEQHEDDTQDNSDNNNNTQVTAEGAEPAEEAKEDSAKKDGPPEDENTVYVRDSASGVSVPVAKVVTTPQKTDAVQQQIQGHYSYGEPFFSHGPNGPRFPLLLLDPQSSPLHCNNPGGACNYRPLYESPAAANPYYNTQRPTGGDNFFGPTYTLLDSAVPTHQQSIFVPQDPRHPLDLSYTQMSPQSSAEGPINPTFFQQQTPPLQQYVQRSPPLTEDSFSDIINPGCSSVHPRGSSFCVIHTEQPRSSNYKMSSNASSRSTSSGNGPTHSTPK